MSKTATMLDWVRAAREHLKTGVPVTCPVCGKTDSVEVNVTHFGRTSYTFLCKSCGSGAHLDGTTDD